MQLVTITNPIGPFPTITPVSNHSFFFSSKTNKTHTGLELSEFLELMEIHRHEQTRSVKYKPSFFN